MLPRARWGGLTAAGWAASARCNRRIAPFSLFLCSIVGRSCCFDVCEIGRQQPLVETSPRAGSVFQIETRMCYPTTTRDASSIATGNQLARALNPRGSRTRDHPHRVPSSLKSVTKPSTWFACWSPGAASSVYWGGLQCRRCWAVVLGFGIHANGHFRSSGRNGARASPSPPPATPAGLRRATCGRC